MRTASKRSGRISFVAVGGICSIMLVAFLFLFSSQSPRGAAAEFLTALAKGDTKRLAELSVIGDKTRAEIKQAWDETMKYSRIFTFSWEITNVTQRQDSAAVTLQWTKTPESSASYADHYEMVLVKDKSGNWKVDVPQMPRDMFPNLPQ